MKEIAVIAYLLASIISGEAADCGASGRWLVAQSIATRRADGQSWSYIVAHYYARREPDELSLRLADKLMIGRIRPSGIRFVLSQADVLKLGFPKPADITVQCAHGLSLHGYRRWKGAKKSAIQHIEQRNKQTNHIETMLVCRQGERIGGVMRGLWPAPVPGRARILFMR